MTGTPQETQTPPPTHHHHHHQQPQQPQQQPEESYVIQPQETAQKTAETSSAPPESSTMQPQAAPSDEDKKKWGTDVMGPPAVPTVHPDNQKAAQWNAGDHQQMSQHPYVQFSPLDKSNNNSPFESVCHIFNSWSTKAETIARNVWYNLKTGPSVSGSAWGKMNLTAQAITKGGFEALYKQTFATDPNEKLKKTFACYLSTSTGPVAGTLYLSTAHVAFCSDRPLSFIAPSGQKSWSYYKVMVPLGNVGAINPVSMKETEKYIQIVSVDGHDFWFMGFVNYEKASHHLLSSVSEFRATGHGAPPVVGNGGHGAPPVVGHGGHGAPPVVGHGAPPVVA